MADQWIPRKKNWISGRASREKSREPDESDAAPEKAGDYGVIYYPIRCPRCMSKNQQCYSSRLPVRYHRCRHCGLNFKSTEAD